MSPFWKAQARRIDALSLRERVIMFVSLVLVLGALADTLVLAPQMAMRRALAEQLRRGAGDLDALRSQLAAAHAAAADSPEARQRAAVEAARHELQQLDAQLQARLADPERLTRLPGLLQHTLRRHERLVLTRLATLPPEPAAPGTPEAGALRWQGVELGVAGRYLDLMTYLADLERELPGVRWGALTLASQGELAQLNVRVLVPGGLP
ncbi:hypothetical protein [Piscinibacter defluvii]|uniref:hypothetical protein n=1 Tax=Piscinibacter defluvii TaxID=1796922 RepID=UPI000FDD8FBE|nr:hypothetical protein [Piscinibacter defluvii]